MTEQAKIYLARAGASGEDEDYALENGLAIIGFIEVGSLEGLPDYESVFSLVRKSMPGAKPRQIGNISGQLWAFAIAMKFRSSCSASHEVGGLSEMAIYHQLGKRGA
jgi:predicted Mrr-cat superfamily restriction endonuclease